MRSEEMNDPFSDFINSDLTPKSILAELNQEVIGQDHVKILQWRSIITTSGLPVSKVTLENQTSCLLGQWSWEDPSAKPQNTQCSVCYL